MPTQAAAAVDVESAAQLSSSSPADAAAPAELTMPAQAAATVAEEQPGPASWSADVDELAANFEAML
jgi:hypothetical protein